MIKFEKVSFDEYKKTRLKLMNQDVDCTAPEIIDPIFDEWKNIELPTRATIGSAGYDFRVPYFTILTSEPQMIPTGIRAEMDRGVVLMLYPRSGFGMKFGMKLENTCGVVDEDYFYADNEGHIMCKTHTDKPLPLTSGERFMQGIFVPYLIAANDTAIAKRSGGMGSTGTK